MIPDHTVGTGEITRWGDPWHGLITNGTLALPGGATMPTPGAAPVGGDCYLVQVPAQPAITTPPADSALGMTWLNHALMSGTNHCLFGVALGKDQWIYVDNNGDSWLAKLRFDIATRAGNIDFTRFGVLPGAAPAVVQTVSFSVSGQIGGTEWAIDDINATGGGVAIVTFDIVENLSFRAFVTLTGNRNIRGAFELVLSGNPPGAVVAPAMIASEIDAAGEYFDSGEGNLVYQEFTWPDGPVSFVIPVSDNRTSEHRNKLLGVAYKGGVASKFLRTLTGVSGLSASAAPVGSWLDSPNLANFSQVMTCYTEYKITFGGDEIKITASINFSKSGQLAIDYMGADRPVEYDTSTAESLTLDGTTSTRNYLVSIPNNIGGSGSVSSGFGHWSGLADYLGLLRTPAGGNEEMILWPQRLGNGLFCLAMSTIQSPPNQDFNVFVKTAVSHSISPSGVTFPNLSSTSQSAVFRGSRQPVSGLVTVAVNDAVCYR